MSPSGERVTSVIRRFVQQSPFWVSIDDREGAYLKVILDEIFGRGRFIAANVWQKRYSRENREAIGDVHEYIYVYAMNPKRFKELRNKIPLTEEQAKVYKNPNNDPNGRWRGIPMTAQEGHATAEQYYAVETPTGKVHYPSEGRCWGIAKATYERLLSEGRIYFGKSGDSQPNIIRYLSEVEGMTPWTWWPSAEVGHTDSAKKEIHSIFGKVDAFETPKPETLMERLLHIATNPGDLVMDSFLGSGTTAAVAQKMGRRYIGIEMGDHAVSHCQPRLAKVVDGEQGGISKAQGWQGGGGFRFFKLGAAVFDETGGLQPDIRFATLAAHIWFSEMHQPWNPPETTTPFLGALGGRGIALLYNGILGDKSVNGGNVLNRQTLRVIRDAAGGFDGPMTIYGERTVLSDVSLAGENITFKQTPYDVRARK